MDAGIRALMCPYSVQEMDTLWSDLGHIIAVWTWFVFLPTNVQINVKSLDAFWT